MSKIDAIDEILLSYNLSLTVEERLLQLEDSWAFIKEIQESDLLILKELKAIKADISVGHDSKKITRATSGSDNG